MSKEHLLKRKEGISLAAWQLEDTVMETIVDRYPTDMIARTLHLKACQARMHYNKAMVLMLMLTVFETPSWCNNTDNVFTYADGATRCAIPNVSTDEVLLSNLPYLPPGWCVIIELGIIFVIAKKLYLERQLQVRHFSPLGAAYSSLPLLNIGLFLVAFELIDCMVFMAFRPKWRLAFISRTGYICLLPAVRRLASCIVKVFSELFSIASFYVVTVLFFAWIVATIFNDSTETLDTSIDMFRGEPANKGLDTFRSTVNTMFVAGSTEEFLPLFVPSYTTYRWSGFLWLTFLVVAKLLLLNLVLDTLVATYLRFAEDLEDETTELKVRGIQDSFHTLSTATGEENEVSKSTFLEFVDELSRSPQLRSIKAETADVVFAACDSDDSGMINKREFCDLCAVIEYDFWATTRYSFVRRRMPWLWESRNFVWLRERLIAGQVGVFMNWVLLLNLVSIIWETMYDMWDLPETLLMENVELLFSVVYVGEVAVNLSVHSFGFYWSQRSNQFDFVVTWLLLASSLLDEAANSAAGADIKRYMNVLRLLRLLRVLKQLKRLNAVQKMVQTISNLVTASAEILTLLGASVFFFSTLSVQLWGGILYASNPALEGTEYKEKHLFALNFNDVSMAFGVWIVNLLCEYLPDAADVISKASGIPGSWIVLVIFYVLGVSIIFELVKAFTIEVFVNLNQSWGKEKKEFVMMSKVIQEFERRDLCLHYRVVGDLSTHEKMVEALGEMDEELEKEREEGPHEHGANTPP